MPKQIYNADKTVLLWKRLPQRILVSSHEKSAPGYCLINVHIFDYPDSRLSGLFPQVPTSLDNQDLTVLDLLCTWRCQKRDKVMFMADK